MDVVTAYLYGSLDSEIYMKVPDGINIPNHTANRNMYCVKLQKSLYGLKQSGRMWYNCLSEFLSLKEYTKNDDCRCVFIKKTSSGFCIISVYVDDLNIIGNETDINEAPFTFRNFLYQSAYIQKILEKFNIDKSYPAKTPMVGFPYLSVIGALMYLANSIRLDIAFAVNLLARYSASPTKRYWNGVKNVFRYLNGTRDLGLFYGKNQEQTLVGYTDTGYLSDPHNARSQTGFISYKQTLVATSTNYSEIIALYEASKECVWLQRMINHILQLCGLGSIESPTTVYEDNVACIVHMETCYIKSNITKHIAPKLFYPHALQKKRGEINILQTKSCDNLADLFTKCLPYSSFSKYVKGIGMRRFRDLQESGE
ncbi:hypothetical protein BS78_07G140200 [Paspalum vaginatum]|nr:hypothetical protein BS78_07G140200 [Paspalum vaginatum]